MWRKLVAPAAEGFVAPWSGGRELAASGRRYRLSGRPPPERGWHRFAGSGGREATWVEAAEPPADWPGERRLVRGYLVGDRLVPDEARFEPEAARIRDVAEPLLLAERGLGRFPRVAAARWEDGRLLYAWVELPLGPEAEVERRYEDQAPSIEGVRGVSPALALAFRWATWLRDEAEAERARQRAEREAAAQAEREAAQAAALEAQAAAERTVLAERMRREAGTAEERRRLARLDFPAAAAAALRASGAELLDTLPAPAAEEMIVRYRHLGLRLECVVNRHTLRVVDAGVCLTDGDTGERGDTRFTLESLPAVIAEAERDGALVVFRRG